MVGLEEIGFKGDIAIKCSQRTTHEDISAVRERNNRRYLRCREPDRRHGNGGRVKAIGNLEVSLEMRRYVSGGHNHALGDGDGLAVVVDKLPGNFNWKTIDGTSWLPEDQQAGTGLVSAVHSVGGSEFARNQIVPLAKATIGDEVGGDGFQRIPGWRRNGGDSAIASGVSWGDQLESFSRVPN